jgi:16S rRNA (cytosine967-C5)-methyltransferase
VHLAVDAARDLDLSRASGFVNAVLRRFVRERSELLARLDQSISVRHAHPQWLVDSLQAAWGDRLTDILQANNGHPPMVLRVARSESCDRDSYQRLLAAEGRASVPISWLPDALQLEHPAPVSALPFFAEGAVSVQDPAAQLAAYLLACTAGHRVLDACAAPGGKSAHLLQQYPGIELLAVDNDPQRLRRVSETFVRIGCAARTQVADMADPSALKDAVFERILLDAPCSATGVIRRHPDIKLLRRKTDISTLAANQKLILKNCFARLAPGGRLVYATCSLLPEENAQVIHDFLADEPDAQDLGWPKDVLQPAASISLDVGVQLLPGSDADHDGFYYACLGRKRR